MDIALLKHLGHMDQLAGIRRARLLGGAGQGMEVAEFYNAAGLRFTVLPDRCMDLCDLSYKGINLAFQSKNGPMAPQTVSAQDGEFLEQWTGGALVTCGLDNVGGHARNGGTFPTHGRITAVSAEHFGTDAAWEGEDYILKAEGQMHQTRLYGRHLALRRSIRTGLYSKSLEIRDVITNFEAEAEPYMLLYHINFGYPLLQADSRVAVSGEKHQALVDLGTGYETMLSPIDGRGEELFLHSELPEVAKAVLWNPALGLGVYVSFDTKNLPNMIQWKMMKSHDYVLALEPCNTCGLNRDDAIAQGKIASVPGYSSIENRLELGILEGEAELNAFLKTL